MKIKAKIYKQKSWWVVECNALDIFTQGKTKKEAMKMLCDAINELCKFYYGRTLNMLVIECTKNDTFIISSNINLFFSFILRRVRESLGKSQKDIARELNCNESNYRRYETGEISPTLERFYLLKTIVLEKKHVELLL